MWFRTRRACACACVRRRVLIAPPRKPAGLAASCQCSEARVFRTLRLLPRSEIDDIMEKNEEIEVKCEFCGKRYRMTPEVILENLEGKEA